MLARHATTLVLVTLAIVLGAVLVWDRGRVSTAEAESRRLQLFDAWRLADLTSLIVETPKGKVELTRERDDDGEMSWTIRERGEALAADDHAVEDFLLTLEYAGYERKVEGQDRAALGLATPDLTVTLGMGQLKYVLRVGKEAPSPPGSRYVEVEGGARPTTAYVIKKELAAALFEEPRSLRSKRLVPYLSSEVERYELGGDKRWALARGVSGGRATVDMMLESSGSKQRANWRAVDGWTTVLARLEALRFVEGAAPSTAGGLTLTIVPRNAKRSTAELVIGGACPGGGTMVRRTKPDPVVACVNEKIAAGVGVDASFMVDRHVLGVPENDVSELVVKDDVTTVDIARRGDGWHMRKPEDSQIPAAVGNALLERIAKAEGEIVAGEAASGANKLGLDPPRATMRVVGVPDRGGADAKEHVEEIVIGRTDKGSVHVRRSVDGLVLRLSADAGAALVPAPSALRSTQIYQLALEDVRELAVDCGKKQRMSRDAKGSWTRLEPDADLRADLAANSELAEAVRTLTAVRWASEKAEAHHELDKPWCSIALTVAERDEHGHTAPHSPDEKRKTLRLMLGAETSGGYFATRDGLAPVFVAPRALGQMAKEWLLDRGALMIDPIEVDRVTVTVANKKLVLARRGDGWMLADDANGNDTRAAVVGKALESLLAEGVVSLGPPHEEHGIDGSKIGIVIARREGKPKIELIVGAGAIWRDTRVFFVRKAGTDATFAVGQARLQPILDAP
jgi:hypothetical protein